MTKSNVLGMDIGQDSVVAQLSRADGTPCWRGKLPSDRSGWQILEQVMASHQVPWADTLVIFEATGVYHFAWAERLSQAGAEVHVLNALLASRLESTANALRQHKTDEVDASRFVEIGQHHADKLGRFRYKNDPAKQALKQLDHARAKLREVLTNLKKSVQSHLELVFPALLAAGIESDSVRAVQILAVAPTAGAWLALPVAQRCQLAKNKQPALDQACLDTLADEALAQACVPAVRSLLSAQQAMTTQLEDCDYQIAIRRPASRVALITSLPGFGERTATVMTTYLPDSFEGWGSRKKITARLQALFGIDPRLRRSGKWTGRIKMSKRGIGSARTALFQAAFCSLRTDPHNAAYYQALRHRGKDHKTAIVDVMRKQLRRLVAVLLSGRPFTPFSPPKQCLAA